MTSLLPISVAPMWPLVSLEVQEQGICSPLRATAHSYLSAPHDFHVSSLDLEHVLHHIKHTLPLLLP